MLSGNLLHFFRRKNHRVKSLALPKVLSGVGMGIQRVNANRKSILGHWIGTSTYRTYPCAQRCGKTLESHRRRRRGGVKHKLKMHSTENPNQDILHPHKPTTD